MAGSRRRRQLQRQKQRGPDESAPAGDVDVNDKRVWQHGRHAETPWLVLPSPEAEKATVVSVADSKVCSIRALDPAMRGGHVVVGSSLGWLVTADTRGALRVANLVTGVQIDLPPITTIPAFIIRFGRWLSIDVEAFANLRFSGASSRPPDDRMWGSATNTPSSITLTAQQIQQCLYRKVVLSASPRSESYAAMLILGSILGAPAFATLEDPSWRVAPSRDGIEDAISHDGRFYSITYSGVIEAWDHDGDSGSGFKSTVVAPKLNLTSEGGAHDDKQRKYLAMAPDGRFMVVVKESMEVKPNEYSFSKTWKSVFKVHVLDQARQVWEETPDIGETALFVGVNSTICLPTTELGHPGIRSGCVYFTDDDLVKACWEQQEAERTCSYSYAEDELKPVGVYCLSNGSVEKIPKPDEHLRWPLPAWFIPAVF